jgi:uncharacterized protein YecT (DUF1311 family)
LAAADASPGGSAQFVKPTQVHDVALRNSYYECTRASDGSTWEMQACIEKEFVYQDSRLNVLYRVLRSKMDDAERARFKVEERQWLSDMEGSCKWNASVEGQAQRLNANVCSLKMTAARVGQFERKLSDASAP